MIEAIAPVGPNLTPVAVAAVVVSGQQKKAWLTVTSTPGTQVLMRKLNAGLSAGWFPDHLSARLVLLI